MRYCNACKVYILDGGPACPLCHRNLPGEIDPGEAIFPKVPAPRRPGRKWLGVSAFASVGAVALCFAVNLAVPAGGWWALFVLGGVASLWAAWFMAGRQGGRGPRNVAWTAVTVCALALVWDLCTGFHRWSLAYVIPIQLATGIFAVHLATGLTGQPVQKFAYNLFMLDLLGMVPLVPALLGAARPILPSVICAALSLISLAQLLFINRAAFADEMKRRLHL